MGKSSPQNRIRNGKALATGNINHGFASHQRKRCSVLKKTSMDDLKKPILPGKGASDYERYLHTDDLLALQKLPKELLHQDELTFQVVHQSSELLMKGAAFELERAHDHIVEGDFSNATRLLRRAN